MHDTNYTLALERGRDIAEVELLATCLLDANYIVKSALDIALILCSMNIPRAWWAG